MNTEQRVAFIQSQCCMMNAEMEMMKAENKYRENLGQQIAYGQQEWSDFRDSWEAILGHNSVIEYLRG